MDVIEDAVTILRIVLDYMGVDPDDMAEFVQRMNERGRDIFQRVGHGAVVRWDHHFVQRYLRITHGWRAWRGDIRHRNIIRIVGTSLPLKSPKRLKIQKHLLRPHRRRHDSCDSDSSLISLTSVGTMATTDDDLVWVEEDLGNNCIRMRAQKRNLLDSDSGTGSDLSEEEVDFVPMLPPEVPLMNSTMISSTSMMSSNDPLAMDKINALEDELTNLRSQIAMLVLNQEQNKSQMSLPGDTATPPPPPPPPLPPCPVVPPVAVPLCSVAPPVPALRIQPEDQISTQNTQEDTYTKLHEKQDKALSERVNIPNRVSKPPCLTDVLKGLGSVKLRSIQRSPGGTPVRKPPVAPSNTTDPASLIAVALKKKFAHKKFDSPEMDKENDSHNFSSPEDSPNLRVG
ncbi:hypothetical protein FSP39_014328 [Pinctada imbricata]|uniref:Mitochondrial fission regulator 2 n=1 Tax=Pinctada imbricata TaxID=66713 RepID=A0AA88Y794_PINIB|nr:hypothetical protein FSP39_014328 [Pinctada imbricata]